MKTVCRFAFVLGILAIASQAHRVTAQPNKAAQPSLIPGITVENYPRVDGSTSTIPLGQLLASYVVGLRGEWRRIQQNSYSLESTVFCFPVNTRQSQILEYQKVLNANRHNTTHNAYMALIDGKSDLLLIARPPSPDEVKAAQAKKVQLDSREVALDAFIFLVNTANPVQGLTLDQARAIFTGKTKLWREVGGKDFPIKTLTRDRNSGSQELMDSLVMKGNKMIAGKEAVMVTEMGEVINRIAASPHAIGYSVYYYEQFMASSPNNKLLAVNGIAPTAQTIAERRYPLTAPVYVVTRKGVAADSSTIKLRDWLLGNDGQQMIAGSGYVPVKKLTSTN